MSEVELSFIPTEAELPPQNIDAEESILGGILFEPGAIERVANELQAKAFYVQAHQIIYEVMIELHLLNLPTDMLAVSNRLSDQKLLKKVGGRAKLANLLERAVSAVNIDALAVLINDKAIARQIISCGHRVTQLGWKSSATTSERLDDAEALVMAIKQGLSRGSEAESIAVTAYEVLDELDKIAESGDKLALATGLYDLDEMLSGGFYPGNLVLVGARPGAGKSLIANKFAYEISKTYDKPTLIISLEMGKADVVQRYYSQVSGVPLNNIRRGLVTQDQREQLALAAAEISQVPVFIDDTENVTIGEVKTIIRKAVSKHDVCAVVIDYLQLIEFSDPRNLVNEVGDATRQLKLLAKQLNIPIILLSQLNRSVESRGDKRPLSSDLRDSGGIESNADIILLLYRDEYYNKDSQEKGVMEIICTKHRNGATGTVKVLFDGAYCRIRNMAK